jgi:hypothetical protein
VPGQRPQGPVRGRRRRPVQGGRHNTLLKGLPSLRRSPATGRVVDNPRNMVSRETLPPQAYGWATAPHEGGNVLIDGTLRGEQHNLSAKNQGSGGPSASRPLLQLRLCGRGQLNGRDNTHRHLLWFKRR